MCYHLEIVYLCRHTESDRRVRCDSPRTCLMRRRPGLLQLYLETVCEGRDCVLEDFLGSRDEGEDEDDASEDLPESSLSPEETIRTPDNNPESSGNRSSNEEPQEEHTRVASASSPQQRQNLETSKDESFCIDTGNTREKNLSSNFSPRNYSQKQATNARNLVARNPRLETLQNKGEYVRNIKFKVFHPVDLPQSMASRLQSQVMDFIAIQVSALQKKHPKLRKVKQQLEFHGFNEPRRRVYKPKRKRATRMASPGSFDGATSAAEDSSSADSNPDEGQATNPQEKENGAVMDENEDEETNGNNIYNGLETRNKVLLPLKSVLKKTNYTYKQAGRILRSHSAAEAKAKVLLLSSNEQISKSDDTEECVAGGQHTLPAKKVRFARGSKETSNHVVLVHGRQVKRASQGNKPAEEEETGWEVDENQPLPHQELQKGNEIIDELISTYSGSHTDYEFDLD
ncbi:hypothetical protein H072_7409 [Dactylellina haptotyla CBS 200.50]|uniref:Uncharacterized protein n=1 Tax=Dactylellina haptotyla (strain CBS 200.50) TaxID=1284197 RepID=S8A761_DACHA|nr:hypothetical protein H072_7409 [Dactylellina haptotyla CBS 200.50]